MDRAAHIEVDWPLVGRRAEIGQFLSLLREPDAHGLIFFGPGGVGKTRLARECRAMADEAGWLTLRIVATRASQALPFVAFSSVVPDLGESSRQFLALAVRTITEAAAGRRVLLIVDDAHLLDSPSATLLYQLAANRVVTVLCTVRSGEPVPEEVSALWTEGIAERLIIGDLEAESVEELLSVSLEGSVDTATRAYIHRVAQGNPLATRELLLGLAESGTLASSSGHWTMTGELGNSPRLAELVERRLGGCTNDELQALEITALGEPLPIEILEKVVAPAVLESLERRSLVTVAEEHGQRSLTVRLTHPLHGEILRAAIGALRHRNVCRALADAADQLGMAGSADLLRVAAWRATGGGVGDPARMLAAARRSFSAGDFDLALRIARADYAANPNPDSGHLIGWILSHNGELAEAERVLDELASMSLSEQQRTHIVMAQTTNLVRLYRTEEAIAELLKAEPLVTGEFRAELMAHRAAVESMLNEPTRVSTGIAALEELILRDDRASLRAAATLAGIYALDGLTEQAMSMSERALAKHLASGEEQLFEMPATQHLVMNTLACTFQGRFDDAETAAQRVYERPKIAASERGWSALALGMTTVNRGRVRTAHRYFHESAASFGSAALVGAQRWSLGRAASSAILFGDLDAAQLALKELDGLGVYEPQLSDFIIDQGRAWVAAFIGDIAPAIEMLDTIAESAMHLHQRGMSMIFMQDIARLRAPELVADRARRVAVGLEGPLNRARFLQIEGYATRHPDILEESAQLFERCGSMLYAAESAALCAEVLGDEGGARAATAAARSRRLWQHCEGAVTPILQFGSKTADLTQREREIALLAASGSSSKVIAEQLYVSKRTVENSLQRVYEKLGVNTRSALKDLLSPD